MALASPRALADAGDLDGLVLALQQRQPSLRDVRALLSHRDARVVQAGLVWLLAECPRIADPDLLGDLAAILPTNLAALAPEAHAPCAGLYAELARWGACLPAWRGYALPAALALPWLTAGLLTRPRPEVEAEGASERLLQALAGVSGGRCLDPLGLLDGLIALDAACLAAPALRLLQEAARSASLGAEAVGPRLTRLVEGGSLEALAALNAPWARQVALPRGAVIAALTDPARAPAAVAVLAGRQEADLLWALARASCAARARRRSASWARWPPWRPICCGSPRAIRSRSGPASAPRSWPPTLAGSSSRRGTSTPSSPWSSSTAVAARRGRWPVSPGPRRSGGRREPAGSPRSRLAAPPAGAGGLRGDGRACRRPRAARPAHTAGDGEGRPGSHCKP
ncbi:MAG: hypothetical protein R3F60_01115 [bacterium]